MTYTGVRFIRDLSLFITGKGGVEDFGGGSLDLWENKRRDQS